MDSFLSYKGANLAKMPRILKEIGRAGMDVGNLLGLADYLIPDSGFRIKN